MGLLITLGILIPVIGFIIFVMKVVRFFDEDMKNGRHGE